MIAEPDLADGLVTLTKLDLRDGTTLEDHEVLGGQVAAGAERISLRGCRLSGVTFTGARLRLVTATDFVFDNCEFSGAIRKTRPSSDGRRRWTSTPHSTTPSAGTSTTRHGGATSSTARANCRSAGRSPSPSSAP